MIEKGNVTVMVTDMKRAVRFYTETLGFKVKYQAGEFFAEVEIAGLTVGLHPQSADGPRAGQEGAMSIGLQVADLDTAMADLAAKGAEFKGSPVDDGAVKLAFFGDPDGNPLYLCQVMKWS